MDDVLVKAIHARSRGRCEAEVSLSATWSRCGAPATDIHHMLPKSRGGRNLDRVHETAHLIHLCREDHILAHSKREETGLMIEGRVVWNKLTDRPEYQGPDPELTKKYGPTDG